MFWSFPFSGFLTKISGTDSVYGNENSWPCLLRTNETQFCTEMAGFSISPQNYWIQMVPLNTAKSNQFYVPPPEEQCWKLEICKYNSTVLLKKRKLEWNFIEHSKLNMARWLAVWTCFSHFSRRDDTWWITTEEWCNIRPNCWWLCTAWVTVKQVCSLVSQWFPEFLF